MPDLVEQMYCSQQILIPPNLPSILKRFAKGAIRTQPHDLLQWSSSYFRALADGVPPPVKARLEYTLRADPTGLSPGFLKVLINQVGKEGLINREVLMERWKGVCLSPQKLEEMLRVGSFGDDVEWLKFVAIAAGTLERNLKETMILLCELLTEEPEGGSARVPLEMFLSLYSFLAKLDCGPVEPTLEESEEREQVLEMDEEDQEFSFDVDDQEPPPLSPKEWDSVVEEILEEKSEFSVCTIDQPKDQNDVDGVVWPHLHPESESELSVSEEKLSEPASDMGIQVFEPGLEDNVENITRLGDLSTPPPEEVEEEELEVKEVEGAVGEGVSEGEGEKPPEGGGNEGAVSEEGTGGDDDSTQTQEGEPQLLFTTDESKFAQGSLDHIKTMGEEEGGEEEEEESGAEEEAKKEEVGGEREEAEEECREEESVEEQSAVTIMSPDPSINLIESPVDSEISFHEKSLHDVTRASVLSVGEELGRKVPLVDVQLPTGVRDRAADGRAQGDQTELIQPHRFHKQIPGIGPPVPQPLIDQVEEYLRACAEKQCGTVMPRNIRHFTCPDLSLEVNEDIYDPEEIKVLCNLKAK